MTPTFNVGDTVRRKESNKNNRAYDVGTSPFEITDIKNEFVVDQNDQRHDPDRLEPVEEPKYAIGGYVYGHTLWSSSKAKAFLKKLNDAASTPASQLEDIKQTATLGERLNTRDRHITHIQDLDAVIRRRNETIERQKAQLSEYAAQLESVYTSGAFPFKPLRDLQKRIGEANAAKGFHEEGRAIRVLHELNSKYGGQRKAEADATLRNYYTARLALITTEVAEAIEELRNGRAVNETWYENPPLTAEALRATQPKPKPLKPEGIPSELADVVIRSFDFAHEAGIDLAAIINEKLTYNATRAHRHGRKF